MPPPWPRVGSGDASCCSGPRGALKPAGDASGAEPGRTENVAGDSTDDTPAHRRGPGRTVGVCPAVRSWSGGGVGSGLGSYGRGATGLGGRACGDVGRSPIASMRRYARAAAGSSIGSGRPVAMRRSSARSMPAWSAAAIWRARVGQCGSAVMPGWIVSASRAAAGSSVIWSSAGFGDASVELPLVTAARAIVRGRSGRA